MKEDLTKLKRLFQIDRLLRAGKKRTLKEIAEICGVTTRTIIRDFETLEQDFNAKPIYTQNGKRYEYAYEDEHFSLSDISITEEEAFALQRTKQLLKTLPLPKFYERTVRGLESLLERAERFNDVEERHFKDKVIFATDLDNAPPRPDLEQVESVLQEALEKNLPVRIAYRSPTGEDIIMEENYYPLLLTNFLGTWYVLAVKNAAVSKDPFAYQLPEKLSQTDFALLNFYDVTELKIIANSKERLLPEFIVRHENTVTHGANPAFLTYDDEFHPILTFAFWFMDYRVELDYQKNPDTGRIEQIQRLPFDRELEKIRG